MGTYQGFDSSLTGGWIFKRGVTMNDQPNAKIRVLILFILIASMVTGCAAMSAQSDSSLEDGQPSQQEVIKTEVAEDDETPTVGNVKTPQQIFPPTAEETDTSPLSSDEKDLEETPVVSIGGEMEELIALVKVDLGARLSVNADVISVISIESVTWNDSSLGCASPGGMYLQVLTPGYKIILMVDGVDYAYHTDDSGKYLLCENIIIENKQDSEEY
jgi:hypothetical protein